MNYELEIDVFVVGEANEFIVLGQDDGDNVNPAG